MHIFARQMHFLEVIPRSKWLSFAGGVSVAYVFIHIFPELNERQEALQEEIPVILRFIENHVYILALAGFAAFYTLERLVKVTGSNKASAEDREQPSKGVFWLHIGSFAFYNILIGYLLLQEEAKDLQSLFLFFFAMILHFAVNDSGLRQHHRHVYDHTGRWVLSGAVIIGWLSALFVTVEQGLITALFAFLAGSIILNIMKEELPEDRKSSSLAFLIGATLYAGILLAI